MRVIFGDCYNLGMAIYRDEERQAVLALQMQGLGPSEVSRQSGVALRTCERWMASWRELAEEQRDERLLTQATELAIRGQLLQHAVLDAYEEMPPGELVKHAANLNNLTGTNVDKILAMTGKQSTGNATPFVIAIFQDSNRDPEPLTVDIEAAPIE